MFLFLIGLQITKARLLCCKRELCFADHCIVGRPRLSLLHNKSLLHWRRLRRTDRRNSISRSFLCGVKNDELHVRLTELHVIQVPYLYKSERKFELTRRLYSILILGDAKYFFHYAFHNLTNFSISPAVNYRI